MYSDVVFDFFLLHYIYFICALLLSVVTCQDEDSNQYFEGTTWSIGSCIKCSCAQGKIHCSRTAVLVSFLQLSGLPVFASDQTFIEYCNQASCNVVSFVKANKGICFGKFRQQQPGADLGGGCRGCAPPHSR